MARNRRNRTGESVQKSSTLGDRLSTMMFGLVAGVIGVLATNLLVVNWQALRESTLEVDTLEKRQGAGSLKWYFHLRPERRFVFSRPGLSGALLHAETVPDSQGNIPSMNWLEFRALRFFAKSSAGQFSLDEVNLFVGENHVQYVFNQATELSLSTGWRQIEIPFDKFRLAPWVPGTDRSWGPGSAHVTALGFDIKNRTLELQGSVWIDFVRLVRWDDGEVQLSDGDANSFDFGNHTLKWFSGSRDY